MKPSRRLGLGTALLAVTVVVTGAVWTDRPVPTADRPGSTYAGGGSAAAQPLTPEVRVERAVPDPAPATVPAADGTAATPTGGRPVETGLDAPVRGPAAVAALGSTLPAVARTAKLTPAELTGVLESDPTAWVSPAGRVFYQEEIPTGPTQVPGFHDEGASTAPYPLAQTLALHSLPGSTHTIFLDFDGVDLSDTSGWVEETDLPSGHYRGWDPSGDDAGSVHVSDDELASIQEIWARVAEDYSAFDVDVTTQDPGRAALERTSLADQVFGTHVVVTDSPEPRRIICDDPRTPAVDGTCGGVAWTGLIDQPTDHTSGCRGSDCNQIAWVFPSALQQFSSSIAEAASHETGHTFGLVHDGDSDKGDSYYTPNLNGADDNSSRVWAPIMGASYYNTVTQWSKGDYPNAHNFETLLDSHGQSYAHELDPRQDDVALIRAIAGTRPTVASSRATPLPADGTTRYLTTRGASDTYALGTCAANATIHADAALVGPDLDLELSVVDGGGAPVTAAQVNPTTNQHDDTDPDPWNPPYRVQTPSGLGASVTLPAAGGPWYAVVSGAGNLNGNWRDGGYDDYASLGAYTLTVSGCATPGTAPSAARNVVATTTAEGTTVTWEPPLVGAGADVSYTVAVAGRSTSALTDRSFTDPDATSGRVEVSVQAVNDVGEGPVVTARSLTPPGAPTLVGAFTQPCPTDATSQCLQVNWAPPTDDGGGTIDHYRVESRPTGSSAWTVAAADTTTHGIALPGVAGTSLDFRVTAYNQVGPGEPLTGTRRVTSDTETGGGDLPGPVLGLRASVDARARSVRLDWQPPATGGAVTSYGVVVADAAEIVYQDSGLSPQAVGYTLADVPVGTWTFRVVASNDQGSATATLTVTMPAYADPITPVAPGVPRAGIKAGAKGGKKTVVLTWTPGASGTQPISGFQATIYAVTTKGRKTTVKVAKRIAAPATARRLELKLKAKKGLTYAVALQARNAVGLSPLSSRSRAVTPR